ncbi:MAG: septum formation protein Maf [Bacteroidota bacterium]|jgi:septum formation protein
MKKIILASGSPRRKLLMDWAEMSFSVMVSDVDETYDPSLSLENIALSIANKKNHAVQAQLGDYFKDHVLIAADTIVVLNNKIIGKPDNRDDAIEILKMLSGNIHEVITAVDIRSLEHQESFFDKTSVEFHPLTNDQIIHYVDQYKPYDKAGAYAIQEWIGVVGIKNIKGDFYNVMGLPISRVLQVLKKSFL